MDTARKDALDVYFTVDVEVWCDGWESIDRKFPEAFKRYIYGPTLGGDYGLPYVVNVLNDHGLDGSFFVEPLFSARFGIQPLADIVGLLREARQDIQLHLHTEWVDEARDPMLPASQGKRQYLRDFTLDEQRSLVATGRQLLESAGAAGIRAFRAGSFGFNRDTLLALRQNGIDIDASYNAAMFGPASGICDGELLTDSLFCRDTHELPMTVFHDGMRRLRHVQLTACSWVEIESLLWQALRQRQRSFVILSHNFELLDPGKTRSDDVVVRRFRRLCRFLEQHRDSFRMRRLDSSWPRIGSTQPEPLRASAWRTGVRLLEQAYRRRYA